MKELVIISGPTASGKSAAAIELAKRTDGEIISADSMQVYKGMDIGTAKLKPFEMQGVVHHLIDILEPSQDFNVAVFKEKADQCIEDIHGRGKLPIITGGTGFYTQAVLYGIDFHENEADESLRQKLEKEAEEKGIDHMTEKLSEVDSISALKNKGNLKRIIRALEYYRLTGKKLSDKNAEERKKTAVYDAAHFCLTLPRQILYERINERVDRMMRDGLLEEAGTVYDLGIDRSATAMQSLGYKQLFSYFDGEISLDEAVENIKTETRHFAKRQMTWYKRERDIIFLKREEYDSDRAVAEEMLKIMGKMQ